MSTPPNVSSSSSLGTSRRDLLRAATGVGLAAGLGSLGFSSIAAAQAQSATTRAAGSDVIRVGLVGCGGRGRSALLDVIRAADGVEIHALGDVFEDQLAGARKMLAEHSQENIRAASKVTDDTCFFGFDAYRKVIASDVDYVLLALPPYFHPIFAEAAVDAGKHVFVEKPGAVDAHGVRQLLRVGEKAKQKNLGFLAGTQRRHEKSYLDIVGRVHDGAIGKPVYGEAIWNNTDWIAIPRKEGWSDMEWQIRNWRMNRWLCGDTPGVLAIHYIDSVNWAFQEVPDTAYGVGGKIARDNPEMHGNIYDHLLAELTYPSGGRMTGGSRITPGVQHHADFVIGTGGTADLGRWVRGASEYNYRRENRGRDESSYVLEHRDLIESVRAGKPINEAQQLADSSLTAIMIREAGYTGQRVTRDFMLNESQRRYGPDTPADQLEFGPYELEPVAVPGEYELL